MLNPDGEVLCIRRLKRYRRLCIGLGIGFAGSSWLAVMAANDADRAYAIAREAVEVADRNSGVALIFQDGKLAGSKGLCTAKGTP